ncbi:Uncharacterised protein [Mycobacteroides abscessus subsp. abscessus]|nr:Uncharacterised protein [Mycobacteroides abscessus subsp. abscessus]
MPFSDYIGPLLGFGGTGVGAFSVWHNARRKNEIDAARAAIEAERAEIEREDIQRDNDRETAASLASQWQGMLDQQRLTFEALLDPMRKQIADLNSKVNALEAALTRIRGLLRLALDHVRELRSRWPADHPIPDLPDALRDEL